MEHPVESLSPVDNRRRQLQRWIDDLFDGVKVSFIASTNDGEKQINQGELSGLLRTKSFGEKRARSLERQANMPAFFLDSTLSPAEALNRGHVKREPKVQSLAPMVRSDSAWPFKLVTLERLVALQKSLGSRKAGTALTEIDKHLDVLVTRWEVEAKQKKRASA